MPEVQTVRGPIDTTVLGRVLAHEHVFLLNPELAANHPEAWGSEEERIADAVGRLRALKQRGIDTIADPTVLGLGRYLPRIQRIAEQVDLNIVVAPNWHYTHISDEVLPALRERGVAEGQIDTMLVDNPRRYFAGA